MELREEKEMVVLTEEKGYECLGFKFPVWKKWAIISAVFLVQLSMNFNAAVYSNAIPGLREEFGLDQFTAHLPQALFLIMYGFGCELWVRPFSPHSCCELSLTMP